MYRLLPTTSNARTLRSKPLLGKALQTEIAAETSSDRERPGVAGTDETGFAKDMLNAPIIKAPMYKK
jgi:hypothetical protein